MSFAELEFLKVQEDRRVVEICIDRPKALNALNAKVLSELERVFTELHARADVASVILTGAGEKAFVAGADIAEMSAMEPHAAELFARRGHSVLGLIEGLGAPVLAAVNGFALGGGCELALACDVIYASTTAKFGQPEVKLGLMPGFGGAVRLPRKVGYAAAAEWIFTGEIYSAAQAQEIGLVREVLAPSELLGRVREVARLIARRAPLAVQACKRVMRLGLVVDPTSAGALEQRAFAELFATADMKEGTKAFLEKREPTFTGK